MINPIYNLDGDVPVSDQELAAAKRDARQILWVWGLRTIYSTAAFILNSALILVFSYGYPLHAYWERIGKYFVLLWMGLLLVFVVCTSIAINSWMYLRTLEKIQSE